MEAIETPGFCGMGCYLLFEMESEGSLFLHWSETPVPGAIAYFAPSPKKSLPAFKFKQNGGRAELIRGFKGATKSRFYMGVCQFAKQCRDLDGQLAMLTHQAKIFVRNGEGIVSHFPVGELINISKIQSVAAVGAEKTVFDGVDRLSNDYFLGTGAKEGASLALI